MASLCDPGENPGKPPLQNGEGDVNIELWLNRRGTAKGLGFGCPAMNKPSSHSVSLCDPSGRIPYCR
jgi:hypothetical protein